MRESMLRHFLRYPRMQLIDMIKLICQSEFAGGHMISSPLDSLQWLKREYAAVHNGETAAGAFEDIGSGLCRAHLAALKQMNIHPATVNRLFVATANSTTGRMALFSQKLVILRQCCEDGRLPFTTAGVDVFVTKAQNAKSAPLLHHSDVYRAAYRPAYRVVKSVYARFIGVFSRIDAWVESGRPLTVAIDGGAASGKSALAALIAEVYDCNVFHMDDFFLPPECKTPQRLAEPGGNVDYERFAAEVVNGLKSGGSFSYRPYCCQTGGFKEAVTVSPKPLNIVEGVYSLHPSLAGLYNLRLFLKTDTDTQIERIRMRSGDAMLQRFINEWIPLENAYFEKLGIEQACDLVIKT